MGKYINNLIQFAPNQRIIFNIIREKGPISKREILKISHLGWATVSKFVNKLLKDKFIKETGKGKSKGGRCPKLFTLDKENLFILGLDFELSTLTGIVVNLEPKVILRVEKRMPVPRDRVKMQKVISEILRDIFAKLQIPSRRIIGVGIGVPAFLHRDISSHKRNGDITLYSIKGPDLIDIEYLENKFKIPVFVDHNIRAMALSEKWFGKGRNENNLLFLSIRSGIGMAIYINGKLYRGTDGIAGEVGHIVLNKNGPICQCGKRGCFEAYVGKGRIIEQVKRELKKRAIMNLKGKSLSNIDLDDIFQSARIGDEACYRVLEEVAEWIGIVIANLINILNPPLVIIGGDIVRGKDVLEKKILETISRHALYASRENTKVVFSELGKSEGAMGAATIVFQKILGEYRR